MRIAKHPARTITPSAAAALVESNMWLDYGVSLCQPDLFDQALAARQEELTNVKIRSCLSMKPRAVLESDPEGKHFTWFSWHFSGYDRRKHDAGVSHYMPLNLGEVPGYYRRFIDPVDIVILKTCPPDENGFCNFGVTNIWHRALVERAKTVILEITDGFPYVFGEQNGVYLSEVDYLIEGDNQAPAILPNPPPTEVDRAVARQITGVIQDGSCLQVGIGGMPNAVCSLLLESGIRDLGVHTEMLTDGIYVLYKAGMVSGKKKSFDPGKIVFTFALGSSELYAATHRNPDFESHPVDYTNAPEAIMWNKQVVSINNTTQVDLQGQIASESDGFRHLSGTGGQLQFVRGAYASEGGQSFICLASTYEKRGQRRSRIVLEFPPGTIVTAPRTDVMYIVTEYGMVNLKGKSVAERALALISIAHPDFREDLERQAHKHRMIPRGVAF